jgi:hypothetical protein
MTNKTNDMNTLQTSFAAVQSELTSVSSSVKTVLSSNRKGSVANVNYTRFMSEQGFVALSMFAEFLGYDVVKTAFIIKNATWAEFSKYFA